MERDELQVTNAKGNAPVDVQRTARVIDREEQVESVRDAFGEERTRRFIRQRIYEVESKKGGDARDLSAVDDDSLVERFVGRLSSGTPQD